MKESLKLSTSSLRKTDLPFQLIRSFAHSVSQLYQNRSKLHIFIFQLSHSSQTLFVVSIAKSLAMGRAPAIIMLFAHVAAMKATLTLIAKSSHAVSTALIHICHSPRNVRSGLNSEPSFKLKLSVIFHSA
jgi:hypothetical protein